MKKINMNGTANKSYKSLLREELDAKEALDLYLDLPVKNKPTTKMSWRDQLKYLHKCVEESDGDGHVAPFYKMIFDTMNDGINPYLATAFMVAMCEDDCDHPSWKRVVHYLHNDGFERRENPKDFGFWVLHRSGDWYPHCGAYISAIDDQRVVDSLNLIELRNWRGKAKFIWTDGQNVRQDNERALAESAELKRAMKRFG